MVAFELQGVEIDRCVVCRGIWLDHGEIQLIGDLAGVPAGRLSGALAAARTSGRLRGRCPRCRRRLDQVSVGAAPPMMLERCAGGCGLWFDDQEIVEFVARFEEGEEGAVARFFAEWFGARDKNV
jgi:Zn-finger nucleic acid-binding protein